MDKSDVFKLLRLLEETPQFESGDGLCAGRVDWKRAETRDASNKEHKELVFVHTTPHHKPLDNGPCLAHSVSCWTKF